MFDKRGCCLVCLGFFLTTENKNAQSTYIAKGPETCRKTDLEICVVLEAFTCIHASYQLAKSSSYLVRCLYLIIGKQHLLNTSI